MKRIFTLSFLAFFLAISAGTCYALTLIAPVSKADAKKMGIEFRSKAAGPNDVRVEMEFKLEGALKDFSKVELRLYEDGKEQPGVETLKEDRSNPGRVVVGFTATRKQVEKIRLWVIVPETDGGTAYDIQVKDFVEIKKP